MHPLPEHRRHGDLHAASVTAESATHDLRLHYCDARLEPVDQLPVAAAEVKQGENHFPVLEARENRMDPAGVAEDNLIHMLRAQGPSAPPEHRPRRDAAPAGGLFKSTKLSSPSPPRNTAEPMPPDPVPAVGGTANGRWADLVVRRHGPGVRAAGGPDARVGQRRREASGTRRTSTPPAHSPGHPRGDAARAGRVAAHSRAPPSRTPMSTYGLPPVLPPMPPPPPMIPPPPSSTPVHGRQPRRRSRRHRSRTSHRSGRRKLRRRCGARLD